MKDADLEINDFVYVGDMTARILGFEGEDVWLHGMSSRGEWECVVLRRVADIEPLPGRPRFEVDEIGWD